MTWSVLRSALRLPSKAAIGAALALTLGVPSLAEADDGWRHRGGHHYRGRDHGHYGHNHGRTHYSYGHRRHGHGHGYNAPRSYGDRGWFAPYGRSYGYGRGHGGHHRHDGGCD